MQLPEGDRKIRSGIRSCAAVTVFPKTVADDYPMLQMPGKAKSYRSSASSCRILVRERCTRVAQRFDCGVRDDRHGTRRVLAQERQGHPGVCEPRSSGQSSSFSFSRSTSKNCKSGTYSSLSALEQIEDMMVKIAKAERPN